MSAFIENTYGTIFEKIATEEPNKYRGGPQPSGPQLLFGGDISDLSLFVPQGGPPGPRIVFFLF
jgi:hypothetical protein